MILRVPAKNSGLQGIQISATEFDRLRGLILERSGIHLSEHKRALLCARLGRRLRLLGLDSFGDYYTYLMRHDPQGSEMEHMVDAISTNITNFFREPIHFRFLHDRFFPRWKGTGRIRIFSAGCSSGQEPYSLAMCAREYFGEAAEQRVEILAVDISARILKQARQGHYDTKLIQSVPAHLRSSAFTAVRGEPEMWRVCSSLQRMVTFKRMNLTQPLQLDTPFHAVFCRNVSIYFDPMTQDRVFGQLYKSLVPGGSLFVGHSESMLRCSHPYTYVQPTVYERPI